MGQWEYLTKFVRADKKKEGVREFIEQKWPEWKKPPRFTPEAMIPELNQLGEAGWELIHIEPVAAVGSKGDVRFDGSGVNWSNTYFCIFKREKSYDPTKTPESVPPVILPLSHSVTHPSDDSQPAHSPHPAPLGGQTERASEDNGANPIHSPHPAPPGEGAGPH